jgi:RHS repeat-associated protein
VDSGGAIAEYDEDNNLLRKYIYGPGVDQPICMVDVEDSNSVYYYHFDGLGSVVALSDSDGDTVQTYEYSIFGQVAASDPNHPNPYTFTGRRLDFETGLYFYRARYYNPYIGRFMQTDPVGQGTNLYAYCGNNPVGCVDPSGLYYTFLDLDHPDAIENRVTWAWIDDVTGKVTVISDYYDIDEWCDDSEANRFTFDSRENVGSMLSRFVLDMYNDGIQQNSDWFFERLQALHYLRADNGAIHRLDSYLNTNNNSAIFFIISGSTRGNYCSSNGTVVSWNPSTLSYLII